MLTLTEPEISPITLPVKVKLFVVLETLEAVKHELMLTMRDPEGWQTVPMRPPAFVPFVQTFALE